MKHSTILVLLSSTLFSSTTHLFGTMPLRDPFFLQPNISNKVNALVLKGTISCQGKIGGILHINNRNKIVFKGDRIQKYYVKNITQDSLTLACNQTSITLSLD